MGWNGWTIPILQLYTMDTLAMHLHMYDPDRAELRDT